MSSSETCKEKEIRIFPKKIPAIGIGCREFEEGIDTTKVIVPSEIHHYECVICNSVPRRPVFLPRCLHVHCDFCMTQYVKLKEIAVRNHDSDANGILKCPQCNSIFEKDEIIDQPNPWMQNIWAKLKASCPYGCDLKGDLIEIDRHQAYFCPNKTRDSPRSHPLISLPYAPPHGGSRFFTGGSTDARMEENRGLPEGGTKQTAMDCPPRVSKWTR